MWADILHHELYLYYVSKSVKTPCEIGGVEKSLDVETHSLKFLWWNLRKLHFLSSKVNFWKVIHISQGLSWEALQKLHLPKKLCIFLGVLLFFVSSLPALSSSSFSDLFSFSSSFFSSFSSFSRFCLSAIVSPGLRLLALSAFVLDTFFVDEVLVFDVLADVVLGVDAPFLLLLWGLFNLDAASSIPKKKKIEEAVRFEL